MGRFFWISIQVRLVKCLTIKMMMIMMGMIRTMAVMMNLREAKVRLRAN